jgi:hypothetical protein
MNTEQLIIILLVANIVISLCAVYRSRDRMYDRVNQIEHISLKIIALEISIRELTKTVIGLFDKREKKRNNLDNPS